MRKKSFAYLILALLTGAFTLSSFNSPKNDPVGKWEFSAPGAPYGYESGTIEIKKLEEGYSASMKFVDFDYVFEGEKVKFADDKFSFSLYLEGEDIYLEMKFTEENKLSGKAIYSEGELSVSAKREEETR